MQSASQFLIALGGILLLGLLTDALGRRTHLPRVTLLLIFGVIIGKDLLDVIPSVFSDRFEIIADMALLMVGFLLGGRLTVGTFKKSAGQILWISISAAIVTTVMVSSGLIWIGVSEEIAILLGCIASATAPAQSWTLLQSQATKAGSVIYCFQSFRLMMYGPYCYLASALQSSIR